LIQPRDRQFGIEFGRLLETLESFFEKLLVHVGSAEIVQACGFRGIRSRLSLRGREKANRGQERAC